MTETRDEQHIVPRPRPLGGPVGAAPLAQQVRVALPLLSAPGAALVGVYDCVETEFGLVWTTSVVTLAADGTSVYDYGPPISSVVSGTWSYAPATGQVSLAGFRWPLVSYTPPRSLSARDFVESAGFEITIGCTRRAG